MDEKRKSYRVRTVVGKDAPAVVNFELHQTYDTVDVLSLEINQKNFYKMPADRYGVIVGRVIANGGFGIPNAKVSVFIPYDTNTLMEKEGVLYHYSSPSSKDSDGVRYNLLPRYIDDECHQNVGTMYEKEYLLDNKDLIQVFDKYYKYTVVTNDAGDYFIYGVPVGSQTVHVDIDLSDIGVLSQRPRDMIYKGYNADMFESPNKFKKDTNLNSLAQIYSQDRVVTVYPFWGDTSVDSTNGSLTRCDISIDYKFEPTCIFLGSIISDTGNRSISQRCVPDDEMGKMGNLVTGEGKIEMIRKTFDGKVEQVSIKSNNLIDGDGVWCYQIPMNLDYVVTDEFGDIVPTDDPNKGLPTRARVRFRIGMNETETDDTAHKRARFLVPNNPKLNDDYPYFNEYHEADYEFGTFTKEENYRDLFWNKVYTVKSYIPRLQKAKSLRRRVHTGIKNINHAGNNNPFPFNNLFVRLTFTYRFLCLLMKIFCMAVYFINTIVGSTVGYALYRIACALIKIAKLGVCPCGDLCADPLREWAQEIFNKITKMPIKLSNMCDDGNFDSPIYVPIGGWLGKRLKDGKTEYLSVCEVKTYFPSNTGDISTNLSRLFNCVENQLAQDQECTSFNFNNDWVNGVLYAPMWYRKVTPKRKIFFIFPIKSKDKWCDGNSTKFARGLSLCHTCAQKRTIINGNTKFSPIAYSVPKTISSQNSFYAENLNENNCYGYKCHKKAVSFINVNKGLIVQRETKYGEYVYYYKSVEYDSALNDKHGDVKMLFATDIVLLGSLNNCDSEGIPQFFNRLEGTTYNMTPDLVLLDYDSDESKIKWEERASSNEDGDSKTALFELQTGYSPLDEVSEDINESDAINREEVYTSVTGADWGNYGFDQRQNNDDDNAVGAETFIATTEDEEPDFGGLFYGLTCWSAFTKPKSCVNLSRFCEYGVSLDQIKSFPVYSSVEGDDFEYKRVLPDGFVSYDELYDIDGRAMFATMNGNNLKTKTNPKNGFPIYDFMYLYPENFDGLLKTIMYQSTAYYDMSEPSDKNFVYENSSEAYLRFRYGRNRDDFDIGFYSSNSKIGLYNDFNKNRFPKYENSFYFYFGLNSGNTAIDKFRTLYYSDCRNDEPAQSVVSIEYQPNSWCSEIRVVNDEISYKPGDGWLKIDATYVEKPYKLLIRNLSGNSEYDYESENWMEDEKLFISEDKLGCSGTIWCFTEYVNGTSNCSECEDYPPKGYTWLTDNNGLPFGLLNGKYRIQITDYNGGVFSQDIEFEQESIKAKIEPQHFRYKNDYLQEANSGSGDLYLTIATLGGNPGENMGDRNIGGFIKVTDVSQNNETEDVSFAIDVQPVSNLFDNSVIVSGDMDSLEESEQRGYVNLSTSYAGSHVEVHYGDAIPDIVVSEVDNYTLMNPNNNEGKPYCPYTYDCPEYTDTSGNYAQTNGGKYDIRLGVPKGGVSYKVDVTRICKIGDKWCLTRNKLTSYLIVAEPIEFQMFINNINYNYLKKFKTGWNTGNYFPNQYYPIPTSDYPNTNIVGWNNIWNIDGLEPLELLTEESSDKTYEYIQHTEEILSGIGHLESSYNWTDEYVFKAESVIRNVGMFKYTPTVKQSNVNFILVLDNNTQEYYYWIWDNNSEKYVYYYRQSQPNVPVKTISMEEYYDLGLDMDDIDSKNQIISNLNLLISRRQLLAEQTASAFTMYTDGTYFLRITNKTLEKPVKTLILYSPDTDEGTSFETEATEFDQNSCDAIEVSTLTGSLFDLSGNFIYDVSSGATAQNMGRLEFTPIGFEEGKKWEPSEVLGFQQQWCDANGDVRTYLCGLTVKTINNNILSRFKDIYFTCGPFVEQFNTSSDPDEHEEFYIFNYGYPSGVTVGDATHPRYEADTKIYGNQDNYVSIYRKKITLPPDVNSVVINVSRKYYYTYSFEYAEYKKPWLAAIENGISETVPTLPCSITISPDNSTLYSEMVSGMFGIHMLDKRLRLAYNMWAPMTDWPFYYNKLNYSPNEGVDYMEDYGGNYYTLPGLFAGFVLDGVPNEYVADSSGFSKTYFKTQELSENELSIMTVSVDSEGNIDENRLPVVRFIYNSDTETQVKDYINYEVSDLLDDVAVAGYQHICIHEGDDEVIINDGTGNHRFDISSNEFLPLSIEYEFNGNNNTYTISVDFQSDYYYTYYFDKENPVYKKVYNPDTNYMIFDSGLNQDMSFQCMNFDFSENHSTFTTEELPITTGGHTLYVVAVSKDKQRRAISKTFEITPIEYTLLIENKGNNSHDLNLYINVGINKNFYYLFYYDFYLKFVTNDNPDEVWEVGGYRCTNDNVIPYTNNNSSTYAFKCWIDNGTYDKMLGICSYLTEVQHLILTDATGLEHNLVFCKNVRFHSFGITE